MSDVLLTAILSFAGMVVGSFGGILAANKLITHRLEQLEKKVDKHNHLVERMVVVEQSTKSAHKRLDEVTHGKEH